MALPSMPFRKHLCTRSWHRVAVDPVFRNHAHGAPQGFSMVLAGPSRHLWLCLLCLVYLPCIALYALNLAVPKDYFESISAHASGTALGLNPAGDPVFRNHAHGAPQGFSMVLAGPSRHLWLCLVCLVYLPCILLCMPCNQRFRRCYLESISAHASGTALGYNPAADPVFRNHAHGAPHGVSMVLAGPSRHLWLCLVCLLYLPCVALYALTKMLFREHLCARFWHRLGLQSCWGSGVSQPCPRCSTGLFHGIGRSIQTSMALPCMPCKFVLYIALYALYSAVPKMLFREHLCTRFWHRLGLQSCWGSGVSQPCPRCSTGLFHGTGRSIQTSMALPCMPSIFALYCIVCLQFSGSEDAISRASLCTLLAPPWA